MVQLTGADQRGPERIGVEDEENLLHGETTLYADVALFARIVRPGRGLDHLGRTVAQGIGIGSVFHNAAVGFVQTTTRNCRNREHWPQTVVGPDLGAVAQMVAGGNRQRAQTKERIVVTQPVELSLLVENRIHIVNWTEEIEEKQLVANG